MNKKEKDLINRKELSITEKIKIVNQNRGRKGTVSKLCTQIGLNEATYYARCKNVNKNEYITINKVNQDGVKISKREIKDYIYKYIVTSTEYLTQEQVSSLVNNRLGITLTKRSIGTIYPNMWTKDAQVELRKEYARISGSNKSVDINQRWELDIRSIYIPKIDEFFRILICVDTFDHYIVGYEVCDNKSEIDCFKVLKKILEKEINDKDYFEKLTIHTIVREELVKDSILRLCDILGITYKIVKEDPVVYFEVLNTVYNNIKKQITSEGVDIIQFKDLLQKFIDEANNKEGEGELEGRTPINNRYIHHAGKSFMKKSFINGKEVLDSYLKKYS